MVIAEYWQVRGLYPAVPEPAVEHLLWALHRARPLAEANDHTAAAARLRADLATYPGSIDDLARLGVTALFAALERGRTAFASALGAAGLLAPEPGRVARYVVVGPLLEARVWARQRGIGVAAVVPVAQPFDVYRLRDLTGKGVAIVRLGDRRSTPAIELALTALIRRGATTLSDQWRPGAPPHPGEPRLDLRAPGRAAPA